MGTSFKLKNNYYIDSSSIVYNKKTLKSELDKKTAEYTLSSTIGWKRIASFTDMAGGTIIFSNKAGYGTISKIEFASGAGWNSYFNKVFKIITNDSYFTKARIVRKGNDTSYLELYQNLEYERVFTINALNTINTSVFHQETNGGIPTGYTSIEYSI